MPDRQIEQASLRPTAAPGPWSWREILAGSWTSNILWSPRGPQMPMSRRPAV